MNDTHLGEIVPLGERYTVDGSSTLGRICILDGLYCLAASYTVNRFSALCVSHILDGAHTPDKEYTVDGRVLDGVVVVLLLL